MPCKGATAAGLATSALRLSRLVGQQPSRPDPYANQSDPQQHQGPGVGDSESSHPTAEQHASTDWCHEGYNNRKEYDDHEPQSFSDGLKLLFVFGSMERNNRPANLSTACANALGCEHSFTLR